MNTSSIWGLVGAAGVSAYQASKGAVTVITRNAAASFAKAGIRCNSVHPGLIETPLTAPQDPAISQGLVDATPLGRAGPPTKSPPPSPSWHPQTPRTSPVQHWWSTAASPPSERGPTMTNPSPTPGACAPGSIGVVLVEKSARHHQRPLRRTRHPFTRRR